MLQVINTLKSQFSISFIFLPSSSDFKTAVTEAERKIPVQNP